MRQLDERFWSKTRYNRTTKCVEWVASKNSKGYGRFQLGGIIGMQMAHRLSYEAHKGPIPAGLSVCHSCDNPSCVNPDHLWLGTVKDNAEDAVKKGRYRNGERHVQATYTTEQVMGIRADYLAGRSVDEICNRYGVKPTFVHDIVGGRSWKHVDADAEALTAARKQRMKTNAKVTAEIATEIRARLAAGEAGVALAAAYGLHKATISDIKLRKIWADVA